MMTQFVVMADLAKVVMADLAKRASLVGFVVFLLSCTIIILMGEMPSVILTQFFLPKS